MDTIRILGIDVPDAGPVFLGALAVHVPIALVAVVAGVVAMLSAKRAGRHPRAGKIYVGALVGAFVTAAAMTAVRPAETWHLFVLGAAALALAVAGMVWRRHRPNALRHHIVAMGLSYVLMLTAFYVDNGPQLPLWKHLPAGAFWIVPAAVGLPLILRAVRKYQRDRVT